jgi:hypothetical protein
MAAVLPVPLPTLHQVLTDGLLTSGTGACVESGQTSSQLFSALAVIVTDWCVGRIASMQIT